MTEHVAAPPVPTTSSGSKPGPSGVVTTALDAAAAAFAGATADPVSAAGSTTGAATAEPAARDANTDAVLDADTDAQAAARYHLADFVEAAGDAHEVTVGPRRVAVPQVRVPTSMVVGGNKGVEAEVVVAYELEARVSEPSARIASGAGGGGGEAGGGDSQLHHAVCRMLVVRLPAVEADVLVSVTVERVPGMGDGVEGDGGLVERLMAGIRDSLEVRDWGLFGGK